ncbi:lim domain-containing protein plim2c [Phtheirospermum japonicum]|uniref:Lim domain-containing protein plim2c n=1 Tax=Phtheirospermum japonicum TaxID=374723 RepID=A0A830C1X6_9LAMI|nr:lim domain-containing protein plim2c [Phtheirospermum japonicum]
MFSGTVDKCAACDKTVYPLEKVQMEGESFHRSCFKCAHGGCPLTHSSYAALDGILYCKVHFQQLFMEKGNYQHVLDSATHKQEAEAEPLPEPEAKPESEPEPDPEPETKAKTDSDEDAEKPKEQS